MDHLACAIPWTIVPEMAGTSTLGVRPLRFQSIGLRSDPGVLGAFVAGARAVPVVFFEFPTAFAFH